MGSLTNTKKRRSPIGTDPLASVIPLPASGGADEDEQSALAPNHDVAESQLMSRSRQPEEVAAVPAASESAPASESAAPKRGPAVTAAASPAQDLGRRRKTARSTLNLDSATYESMRDTVFALSGPEVQLTLVAFIDSAVRREIKRLEKLHNDGNAFPPRTGKLKTGRPLS